MSNGVLTRGKKLKADQAVKGGDLATAKQLYHAVCRTDPSDGEAWVKLGEVCRQQGDFAEAETYCRKGVRLRPNIGMAHYALGTVLQSQNKTDEAVQCYRTAIKLQPEFAPAHYVLGNALSEIGELDSAIGSLRAALSLRPAFFEALSDLGAIYVALGRDEDAALVLCQALQLRGNSSEVLGNLGTLAERRGDVEGALKIYLQANALQSKNTLDIVAKRCELLEKLNRQDEAKAALEPGLSLDPSHPALNLAAARLERREGLFDTAMKRLRTLLQGKVGRETEIDARLLLGQLEDQAGNAEAALHHWNTAKKTLALANDPSGAAAGRFLRRVEIANMWLDELKTNESLENTPASGAPIFLIGFPRSGTTLLEQVLDSHPKLQAVEERPMAAVVERHYLEMQATTGCNLATLRNDQVLTLRETYFDELKKHIDLKPERQVVDKLPLNIVLVPLLWRIFPNAKFILALRHPCDVCLSCLMQNFGHNDAMAGYVDLDRIATIYARVMEAWMKFAAALPIAWRPMKYEELITDFEPTVGAILDFVGVGWDGSVRDHTRHARERNLIATPSYHQVTQPIYQSARNRWMRYRPAFEPLMARLKPFLDEFGYEA